MLLEILLDDKEYYLLHTGATGSKLEINLDKHKIIFHKDDYTVLKMKVGNILISLNESDYNKLLEDRKLVIKSNLHCGVMIGLPIKKINYDNINISIEKMSDNVKTMPLLNEKYNISVGYVPVYCYSTL